MLGVGVEVGRKWGFSFKKRNKPVRLSLSIFFSLFLSFLQNVESVCMNTQRDRERDEGNENKYVNRGAEDSCLHHVGDDMCRRSLLALLIFFLASSTLSNINIQRERQERVEKSVEIKMN